MGGPPRTWRALRTAVVGAATLIGCGHHDEPARQPAIGVSAKGAPVAYTYQSLDEQRVSSEALRGRATELVFVTTFGSDSLVQVRFANKVFREHVPRINAAAVVMEPMENVPLVRIFRESLGVAFPVAMSDLETTAGKGPFVGLDTAPTTVVLDAQGREVWRKVGVAYPNEVHAALDAAQRAGDAP